MKTAYERYSHLWPGDKANGLKPILERVHVLEWPKEKLPAGAKPAQTILVMSEPSVESMVGLLDQGYAHLLQSEREDFAHELLASTLMLLRPDAFMTNPLPFFFSGFAPSNLAAATDRNIVLNFKSSAQKGGSLDRLDEFVMGHPKCMAVRELVLQAADEMFTNAIFNAPRVAGGAKPLRDLSRQAVVDIPGPKGARLFACYNDTRLIVGCEDPFGSFPREAALKRLVELYSSKQSSPNSGNAGAGLGLKALIDQSANFYVDCSAGQRTLVACGFLLKGMRANLSAAKHVHFSFR